MSGLSVLAFTEPILALEHFKINKRLYALVISDLRMPGLNGLELLTKVKTSKPKVKTILMTAFDIDDNLFQEYTKKEIINGFVQKPLRLNDLSDEVNNQLNAYELLKVRKDKK